MKSGKVSESIMKRSILRPLSGAGAVFAAGNCSGGATPGTDGHYLELSDQPSIVCTSAAGTLGGRYDRSVEMFLNAVINNLAAAGADTMAVQIQLVLPAEMEEAVLQEYMRQAGKVCADRGILIAGGHTEVSTALQRPVIAVTGLSGGALQPAVRQAFTETGKTDPCFRADQGSTAYASAPGDQSGPAAGQELVMAGCIGMAGTVILAENQEAELLKRYPFSLIDAAKAFRQQLVITEAARIGLDHGVTAMHDVSSGGVFGALWEMTEAAGVGLDADLKKIPVRQETIEITDYFGINPYQLYGQGALLLAVSQGGELVRALQAEGIPAAVIGQITDGKDRVLRNGEECRFLERPQQDSLWKLSETVLRSRTR